MIKFLSKLFSRSNAKKNVPRNGKWKEYNRYGTLVSEGTYKNGLRHGTWKVYSDTGQLVIEEDYVNGVLDGTYKAFHENGTPISVGHYCKNKRDGEFRIFREDGILNKVLRFKDGELAEVTEMYAAKKRLAATA